MKICDLPAGFRPTTENLQRASDLAVEAIKSCRTGPYESACVALSIELALTRARLAESVAVVAVIAPNEATSTPANEPMVKH